MGSRSGRATWVGIVGEAGIGKTRLTQETVEVADQRGFVTLAGHAPPRELAVAYEPIVEALVTVRAAADTEEDPMLSMQESIVISRPRK